MDGAVRERRRGGALESEGDLVAWQRFRVELTDHEPLEVQTNARDWAGIPIDAAGPRALDMTFRVVHAALVRTGADGVPRDYNAFLDVLDGIPESLDADDAELMDPTSAAPSVG